MDKQTDRLSLAQLKYQAEIRGYRAKIEELERKIAVIEEVKADASLDGALPGLNGRYGELGLTDAVKEALREVAPTESSPATGAQIRKHLLANGYKPRGKNFAISVGQTLSRLAERPKQRIKTALKDGQRVYWKHEGRVVVID